MDELAQAPTIPIVGMPAVQITPVSGRTLLTLRSWLRRQAHVAPIAERAHELASQLGAVLSDTPRVLSLGPQEWLVVLPERDISDARSRLEPALAKQGLMLVDMSNGLATLDVQGSAARELLSKGCGLDLHPHKFPAGFCSRTRFAQFSLTIACLEPSRYELIVGRSYVHYLQAWLVDAAVSLQGGRRVQND